MRIDHVGYAVKKIDRAIESFEMLGYCFENIIDDPDRNIKVVFGEKDGYHIELVQPFTKDKPSPVDTYLKNIGPTPYHFCYSSDSFEEDIGKLIERGFKVIKEPEPAIAFDDRKVAFMMNLNVGLIEIVEEGTAEHV